MGTFTKPELEAIAGVIDETAKGKSFAFWYDKRQLDVRPLQGVPSVEVHYAFSEEPEEAPISAVSTLLPYLCNTIKWQERGNGALHHHRGDVPLSHLCEGMAQFLNFAQGPIPEVGLAVNPRQVPIPYSINLTRRRSAGVIKRSELNRFKQVPTDSPLVDLSETASVHYNHRNHTLHRIYMMLAYTLIARRWRQPQVPGHAIGAVLVSKGGKILSWGINERWSNDTYHAEVNTLQAYYARTGESAPSNAILYTTLKPCKMCAGMIRQQGIKRIYYGQDDPGGHATGTALDNVQGIQQLALGGSAKPLKLYDHSDYAPLNKHAHLTQPNMQTHLETSHTGGLVTGFLKGQTAQTAMKQAELSLERKFKKYNEYVNEESGNPSTYRVVQHVARFLNLAGATQQLTSNETEVIKWVKKFHKDPTWLDSEMAEYLDETLGKAFDESQAQQTLLDKEFWLRASELGSELAYYAEHIGEKDMEQVAGELFDWVMYRRSA